MFLRHNSLPAPERSSFNLGLQSNFENPQQCAGAPFEEPQPMRKLFHQHSAYNPTVSTNPFHHNYDRFGNSGDLSYLPSIHSDVPTYAEESANEPNLVYDKRPRPVNFKPYTHQDYQAMNYDVKHQKYWELGKLGPDLDAPDLREKKMKHERMREYALHVEEQKKTAPVHPRPAPRRTQSIDISARKRGLDFAKSIPKPNVTPVVVQHPKNAMLPATKAPESLENLQSIHSEHQKKVDAIRRELQLEAKACSKAATTHLDDA